MHSLKKYLSVNPEVKEALINRQPDYLPRDALSAECGDRAER